MDSTPITVTSRSFSNHPVLRSELLKKYSNVKFNDEGLLLKGDQLKKFLQGCSKAITGLEVIDADLLRSVPSLKIISKYGVGLDMIDFNALKEHDVKLGWTAGVNKRSVTELTLGFMLSILRNIPTNDASVKNGQWTQKKGGSLLSSKTVGIVGCGHVGKDLVHLLKPFGCQILVNDLKDVSEFCYKEGVKAVSFDELLEKSDIVTLHVSLNPTSINLIDDAALAKMKSGAVLVNVARGGVIDEVALKKALQKNKISAVAVDVFGIEPPTDVELLNHPNFLATPHIGGSTGEAILAMGRAAIENLDNAQDPMTFAGY